MTKIEIAQLAANLTVAAVTRKIVRETAQDHTNLPDIVVEVGSGVAGAVISDKLEPYTNELVIQVAKKIETIFKKKD